MANTITEAYECWRCGEKFKSWKELFDHKENDCIEDVSLTWSDAAERW